MSKTLGKPQPDKIYVCNNCESDISHGAIICPYCKKTDPKIRRIK